MDENNIFNWFNLLYFIVAPSLGVWFAFKFARFLMPTFFKNIRDSIKREMEGE
jgi:hypothetical protein